MPPCVIMHNGIKQNETEIIINEQATRRVKNYAVVGVFLQRIFC